MKRYLLFYGLNNYPGGGWNDFRGSFDTREEAAAVYASAKDDPQEWGPDWGQVVDLTDGADADL